MNAGKANSTLNIFLLPWHHPYLIFMKKNTYTYNKLISLSQKMGRC